MVLEISGGKDAEACSFKDLFTEFEEAGLVDVTINGHSIERPGATTGSEGILLELLIICIRIKGQG